MLDWAGTNGLKHGWMVVRRLIIATGLQLILIVIFGNTYSKQHLHPCVCSDCTQGQCPFFPDRRPPHGTGQLASYGHDVPQKIKGDDRRVGGWRISAARGGHVDQQIFTLGRQRAKPLFNPTLMEAGTLIAETGGDQRQPCLFWAGQNEKWKEKNNPPPHDSYAFRTLILPK